MPKLLGGCWVGRGRVNACSLGRGISDATDNSPKGVLCTSMCKHTRSQTLATNAQLMPCIHLH